MIQHSLSELMMKRRASFALFHSSPSWPRLGGALDGSRWPDDVEPARKIRHVLQLSRISGVHTGLGFDR